MMQWSFLDDTLVDEASNLSAREVANGEYLFDHQWSGDGWDELSDVEDAAAGSDEQGVVGHDLAANSFMQDGVDFVARGQETSHELLSREQEQQIAAEISRAFSNLQAALGRNHAQLDMILEHISGEASAEQPADYDKIITLYDTLQVYETLALGDTRFEAEYLQVWQRLCDALKTAAINRDYVLGMADQLLDGVPLHLIESDEWRRQVHELRRAVFDGRNRFVSANIRLVYHVARQHMERGMALEDMVQEGVLGLMRAALKFDAAVGVRFSTYAFWWIKQAIRQAIARQRSLIRYPTHINDQVNRVYGAIQDEFRRTGKKPDIKTLQKATGFPRAKVKDLLTLTNLCVSASAPLYDDGDKTLLDDLSYSHSYASPESDSMQQEVTQRMQDLMSVLTPREVMILQMKYGIGHRRSYSLNEIAPQMGVSRERVRQIIEEGIAKIRAAFPDDAAILGGA